MANAPRPRSDDRKRRIFLFVRDRILSGTPPTTREVQAHFGFRAVQSARDYLEALVRDGLLDKEPGKARGYRLPGTLRLPYRPGTPPGTRAGRRPHHRQRTPRRLSAGAVHQGARRAVRPAGARREHARCRHLPGRRGDRAPAESALSGGYRRRSGGGRGHGEAAQAARRGASSCIPPTRRSILSCRIPAQVRILGKVIEVRRYLEGVALLPPSYDRRHRCTGTGTG